MRAASADSIAGKVLRTDRALRTDGALRTGRALKTERALTTERVLTPGPIAKAGRVAVAGRLATASWTPAWDRGPVTGQVSIPDPFLTGIGVHRAKALLAKDPVPEVALQTTADRL